MQEAERYLRFDHDEFGSIWWFEHGSITEIDIRARKDRW